MRHARSQPPRRRRPSMAAVLLGLVLTGWGCHQQPYYFYGTGSPGCVPVVPEPAGSVNSNVGDPPTEVIEGGTSSVEVPNRTTVVNGSQAPKRVVVSEPTSRTRTAWRRNPESEPAIATSVEGGTSTSSSSTIR